MSGHSKWKNIQGRKNAQDAKRGKIFQKISRALFLAAKAGGPDSALNPAFRSALEKAKANNMPNENIQRAIQKATLKSDGEQYAEVVYEGYGPGGVAVLVYTLTDNRNRTATNVRVAFNRNGGSLGETGSVAYLFDRKGYFMIERSQVDMSEEAFLEVALDSGAEDVDLLAETYEVFTDPSSFHEVEESFAKQGIVFREAEVTMIPQNLVPLSVEQQVKLQALIEKLEIDDDVAEVFVATKLEL